MFCLRLPDGTSLTAQQRKPSANCVQQHGVFAQGLLRVTNSNKCVIETTSVSNNKCDLLAVFLTGHPPVHPQKDKTHRGPTDSKQKTVPPEQDPYICTTTNCKPSPWHADKHAVTHQRCEAHQTYNSAQTVQFRRNGLVVNNPDAQSQAGLQLTNRTQT